MLRPNDALNTYLRDYRETRHGHDHDLHRVFRSARDLRRPRHVVYPGSFVHVTPSLVFPSVWYIDAVKGFREAMEASDLLAWVEQRKEYEASTEIKALEVGYGDIPRSLQGTFELMVSLNAGAVSQDCKGLLVSGGHLLANDGHYDAARAKVDRDYTLVAALYADGSAETASDQLGQHFVTKLGEPLSAEMLGENEQRPPSKARFKMRRLADCYLFRLRRAGSTSGW